MNTISRKRVAVLFGGRSVEHEISIITALQLISAIDTLKFEIVPVYISLSGNWYTGKKLLDRSSYKEFEKIKSDLDEVVLLPVPGIGGLIKRLTKKGIFSSMFSRREEVIKVDLFLPAFHGQYGEDGCVQGLMEMAEVTYTGSDVASSAVAMNKYLCKLVARALGISVLPEVLVSKDEAMKGLDQICKKITTDPALGDFPYFVKPLHLGSSIGVGRAKDLEELKAALINVFKYDLHALVEPCVTEIMEINVSVIDAGSPKASVVEIPVSSSGVLSYEEKYLRGGGAKKGKSASVSNVGQGMARLTRVIDPEDLDPSIKSSVQDSALKLYKALGSSGVGRFDFIFDKKEGKLYFNELNPIPGSFSFYLWEKSKPALIYTEEINLIIQAAIDKKARKATLQYDTGFKAL